MSRPALLPTADIAHCFADEIAALGGRVPETFDDGQRLFARAVLPDHDDVQPKDAVHAGVALMTTDHACLVHPYTWRQVCTNGAIRAHAVETRAVDLPHAPAEVDSAIYALRDAVRACAAPDVFAAGIGEMRTALEQQADTVLTLMPMLSRLPGGSGHQFLMSIMNRFFEDADRSNFGLMNAVTSVARETRDPQARWHLECLGAAVPVWIKPAPDRAVRCHERRPHSRHELVGARGE